MNTMIASKISNGLDIEVVSSSFDTVDKGDNGDFAVIYRPIVAIDGNEIELWLDVDTTVAQGLAIPSHLGEDVNLDGSHELVVLSNSDNAMTVADNEDITQSAMNAIDYLTSKYGETNEADEELFDAYYEAVNEVIKKELNELNLEFIKNTKLDEFGIAHSRLSKDKVLGYVSAFEPEEPEQKQEKKQKKSKSLGMSM